MRRYLKPLALFPIIALSQHAVAADSDDGLQKLKCFAAGSNAVYAQVELGADSVTVIDPIAAEKGRYELYPKDGVFMYEDYGFRDRCDEGYEFIIQYADRLLEITSACFRDSAAGGRARFKLQCR